MAAPQLRSLVFYHLDNDLLDTANFLAGRLHALEPRNPDTSHLLALAYLRQRRFKAAHDASHKYGANGRHLGCAYVFAQACLALGRHLDGIAAVEKAKSQWHGKSNWGKHSDISRRHLPDAAAAQTVLGKLWQGHGDLKKAGDCFIEAHKVNAFIWDAFDGLCKIGADLNLQNMFRPPAGIGGLSLDGPDAPTTVAPPLAPSNGVMHTNVLTPSSDPFNASHGSSEHVGGHFALPKVKGKFGSDNSLRFAPSSDWDTPTANSGSGGPLTEDVMLMDDRSFQDGPPNPGRRPRPASRSDFSETSTQPDPAPRKPSANNHKRSISGQMSHPFGGTSSDSAAAPPRRSNRLFGQNTTAKSSRSVVDSAVSIPDRGERDHRPARAATGTKGRIGTTVGRVVSGNRKMLPPQPADKEKEGAKRAPSRSSEKSVSTVAVQPAHATAAATATAAASAAAPAAKQAIVPASDIMADHTAINGLLENLRHLAIGSYAASRFDLPLAIQTFRSVPSSLRETPWVLAQLGKAYYEAADYRASEDCFMRLLKQHPARVEDMEIYSTVLWHLKKDTALAFLCHTLRDAHFDAPQTWCALGNAFSLAREHDQAIAAFRRATQLDASFAYAWALMGHEYISNEELDAALHAFRRSVSADRRGYGGWYGLGKSLERMGKLEDAERHYRIAAGINPANATLLVCVGVVLEKLRNRKAALVQYSRALELDPASALARFKKARVLMHLRCFDQALAELELLRDQAPDEANVWFLLGKCYKGLGERGDALRAFTTALNLDVKASPFIREAMEALDEDDDDEGESEDE